MAAVTTQANRARYALQIDGEQDECGLSENVFRFQACMAGLAGQVDLVTMQGFLIEHDGMGDLCVTIGCRANPLVRCKPVQIHEGVQATRMIQDGVDVRVKVRNRRVLFLNDPIVLNIKADCEPGTRLIAGLKRHFGVGVMNVVVDLGTAEGDEKFNDYFFPDLHLLGLINDDARIFRGVWNNDLTGLVDDYSLGFIYED